MPMSGREGEGGGTDNTEQSYSRKDHDMVGLLVRWTPGTSLKYTLAP